jgi:hypothetical protein
MALTCSEEGLLPLAGTWTPQAICILWKELWLYGWSGSWTRLDGITLAEDLCGWGCTGGGPCFSFNYTLEFALQLRKITENLSQCSRLALDNSCCVHLADLFVGPSPGLLSISPPRLLVQLPSSGLYEMSVYFHKTTLRHAPIKLSYSYSS